MYAVEVAVNNSTTERKKISRPTVAENKENNHRNDAFIHLLSEQRPSGQLSFQQFNDSTIGRRLCLAVNLLLIPHQPNRPPGALVRAAFAKTAVVVEEDMV